MNEIRAALESAREGATHESCKYTDDDPNPGFHCCDWNEVVDQIDAALAALDAQEQRIRDLEADRAGILRLAAIMLAKYGPQEITDLDLVRGERDPVIEEYDDGLVRKVRLVRRAAEVLQSAGPEPAAPAHEGDTYGRIERDARTLESRTG